MIIINLNKIFMEQLKRLASGVNVLILFLSISVISCQAQKENETSQETKFNGVIKTDIRDSKADWTPYTPVKAQEGAPNVLFILYDDTGLAAWSPYGGAINMPNMDKLAENGLTYRNWPTTAFCSPTRSHLAYLSNSPPYTVWQGLLKLLQDFPVPTGVSRTNVRLLVKYFRMGVTAHFG